MSSPTQPLVAALLAAGCSPEDAAALVAERRPGVSWTDIVLDSGKVDEARFLEQLAGVFRLPFDAPRRRRPD